MRYTSVGGVVATGVAGLFEERSLAKPSSVENIGRGVSDVSSLDTEDGF